MSINIRETNSEDYAGIEVLLKKSRSPEKRLTKDLFVKILRRNAGFCFVATDGRKIVGTVFGTHDGAIRGFVYKLSVLPEYKICTEALMKRLLFAFRKRGIHTVFTHVEKGDSSSMKLMKSVGFHHHKSHRLLDITNKS